MDLLHLFQIYCGNYIQVDIINGDFHLARPYSDEFNNIIKSR
jgi:hypothetical protein